MRAIGIAIGLGATIAGIGTAKAQSTYISAPPAEQYTVSPGGVDMRTGKYAYRQADLLIGDEAGLKLERIEDPGIPDHMAPFANMTHNWDIMLFERRLTLDTLALLTSGPGKTDYQIHLSIGGRTESFQAYTIVDPFLNISRRSPTKLEHTGTRGAGGEIYTYTESDGAVMQFRSLAVAGNADCSATIRCSYPSSMTLPDGTKYLFGYDTRTTAGNKARIKSVTSNRGYKILFEYGGSDWNLITKSCVYNLANALAPATGICDSGAISQSSYGYTIFASKPKLASVTDPKGKVSSFTYVADASTPSGRYKMGFLRPGETTPWLTNLIGYEKNYFLVDDEVVWKQDYVDGSSWTYAFDYPPHSLDQPPSQPAKQIAGGYFEDQDGRRTTVTYGFPEVPYSLTNDNPPPSLGMLLIKYYLQSDGSAYEISYYPDGEVDILRTYASEAFNDIKFAIALEQLAQCYECSGPGGYRLRLAYQVTPGPVSVTDPLGRTTTFDYCKRDAMFPDYAPYTCIVDILQSSTDAEGRKTEYHYADRLLKEVRSQAKPGASLAEIVQKATYAAAGCSPKTCHKPSTTEDGNHNVTTYTYDPAHGGILTEVGPMVNGVAPAKKYGYVQRPAWIRNAGGGYSAETNPVWLLSEERSCNSSALNLSTGTCATGAGDLVLVSYDYGPNAGPNNLLLKSRAVTADGQTLRTCFGYDAAGNLISETSPRGECS